LYLRLLKAQGYPQLKLMSLFLYKCMLLFTGTIQIYRQTSYIEDTNVCYYLLVPFRFTDKRLTLKIQMYTDIDFNEFCVFNRQY
jgi:hypothetical protein